MVQLNRDTPECLYENMITIFNQILLRNVEIKLHRRVLKIVSLIKK